MPPSPSGKSSTVSAVSTLEGEGRTLPGGFKASWTTSSKNGYSIGPSPMPGCAPVSWKKNAGGARRSIATCRTPCSRQRRSVAGSPSSRGTSGSSEIPASRQSIRGRARTDETSKSHRRTEPLGACADSTRPAMCSSERLTGALPDRLTHHVHILERNGESYRLQ